MIKPQQSHLEILHRWLRFRNVIDLSEVLRNQGYTSIAIYGGGVFGEVLFEYLKTASIEVKCIIDKNPGLEFQYDAKILQPEFFNEFSAGVDAVILAHNSAEIKYSIAEYTDLPILLLDELIIDIDELRLFYDVEKHIDKQGARLLLIDLTRPVHELKNPSDEEMRIIFRRNSWRDYVNPNAIKLLLPYYSEIENCNEKYVRAVYDSAMIAKTIQKQDVFYLQDIESEYFNVIAGMRYTTGNPKKYDNTIHIFGNCNAVGFFAEDKYTIASQLQSILNSEYRTCDKSHKVLNHSNWQGYPLSFTQILDTDFCRGDIAILLNQDMSRFAYYLNPNITQLYNVNSIFDRPHGMGEVFFDGYHLNQRGYKMLANKIHLILSDAHSMQCSVSESIWQHNLSIRNKILEIKLAAEKITNECSAFDRYIDFLKTEKVDSFGSVGAIVMNCNPFTNGHLYLIEEARKQCDFLYIFVVQEDKSFFKFSDRLKMVMAGTSGLPNIKVVPSGNFIISSVTLPEYFVKEQSPNMKIDASKDLGIFADNIATTLGITKRFVGEEPFDPITNQYNLAMQDILPPKGISVIELPRKKSYDGTPISASRVRALLLERRFDEIAEIVPFTTLEILKNEA